MNKSVVAALLILSLCILLTHRVYVDSIVFVCKIVAGSVNMFYLLIAALTVTVAYLIYDQKKTDEQLVEDLKRLGLREFEARLIIADISTVFNLLLKRAADRLYYALLTQSIRAQDFVKQPEIEAASLEKQSVRKVVYECPECGHLLASLDELRSHMETEHGIEVEL